TAQVDVGRRAHEGVEQQKPWREQLTQHPCLSIAAARWAAAPWRTGYVGSWRWSSARRSRTATILPPSVRAGYWTPGPGVSAMGSTPRPRIAVSHISSAGAAGTPAGGGRAGGHAPPARAPARRGAAPAPR